MPMFKPNLKNALAQVHADKSLGNQIAVISALTSSTVDGGHESRIPLVEKLTGKDFYQKPDVVDQILSAIQEQKEDEKQQKFIDAIYKTSQKNTDHIDALVNTLYHPTAPPGHFIVAGIRPRPVNLEPLDNMPGFKAVLDMYERDPYQAITNAQLLRYNIMKYNQYTAKNKKMFNEADTWTDVANYLKDVIEDHGLSTQPQQFRQSTQYSSFDVPVKAATSSSQEPIITSPQTSVKSKSKKSKSKASTSQKGDGLFSSIQDVMQRANVLIGEIQAGNTNKTIKNEANDLLHFLHKQKVIPANTYTTLIKAINI